MTTSRIGNLTRLIHTLTICVTIYIHMPFFNITACNILIIFIAALILGLKCCHCTLPASVLVSSSYLPSTVSVLLLMQSIILTVQRTSVPLMYYITVSLMYLLFYRVRVPCLPGQGNSAAYKCTSDVLYLKKNRNAPRPSEHPPVRGKNCQNV